MKRKVLALSAILVLVLSAALLADEKGGGAGPGKGMGMGMMAGGPRMVLAMASELNLTPDQMDKIKKIIDEMPKKGGNKEEMQADRKAMQEEMKKDKPDQAKINALIDKIADRKKEAMKVLAKCMTDVSAVLTPEQRDILKKKMEERKAAMKDKKGGWKKDQGK